MESQHVPLPGTRGRHRILGARRMLPASFALLLIALVSGGASASGIAGLENAAAAIRHATSIPVLLPQDVPDGIVGGGGLRVAVVSAQASSYEARLGFGRCNGTGCRFGFIRGARGGSLPAGERVRVAFAPFAVFAAAVCDEGCNMSTLSWRSGPYRYELGIRGAPLSALRATAQSARYFRG